MCGVAEFMAQNDVGIKRGASNAAAAPPDENKLAQTPRSGTEIVKDYELYKYRLYREKYEGNGNSI